MMLLPEKTCVTMEGRSVHIQAWVYFVESLRGGSIPVIFLDTDLPENSREDRGLTDSLYGGDECYRLKQEVILGIGGVRILKELGLTIRKYHMNEGHAAFLTLEVLHEHKKDIESVWDESLIWDFPTVRELCVFTTHTPVEAGHDKFSYDLYHRVLGDYFPERVLRGLAGEKNLNMTLLALNLSNYVNGVAKKHGEISRSLFPGYRINAITNGVHSYTWTSESFKRLYDRYLPGWANEPEIFVRAGIIPDEELWKAHLEAKRKLMEVVDAGSNAGMDHEIFTIGFARRVATYKRATLLFHDIQRLERIAAGKVQLIYAGKAHPKDENGKKLIEEIFSFAHRLQGKVKIAFLKNYSMDTALMLVSGVDVWLNTPLRPLEASGTSGMKAAHNGVLNFSVLDGWWIEGHIEGDTGWAIGPEPKETKADEATTECGRGGPLPKARAHHHSNLLRRQKQMDRHDEERDCQECLLFQYPSNDAPVRHRGLPPMTGGDKFGWNRSRSCEPVFLAATETIPTGSAECHCQGFRSFQIPHTLIQATSC